MAGVIKALIFLVLIGGAIFGAKMFYFDPMAQKQKLEDSKREIKTLIDAKKYDEALKACDKVQKMDTKLKKYCDKHRYQIYQNIAEEELDLLNDDIGKGGNVESAKARTETIIDAVDKIEKYGELTRVHQGWKIIAIGFRVTKLGMPEEKPRLKEAQARSKELPIGPSDK